MCIETDYEAILRVIPSASIEIFTMYQILKMKIHLLILIVLLNNFFPQNNMLSVMVSISHILFFKKKL